MTASTNLEWSWEVNNLAYNSRQSAALSPILWLHSKPSSSCISSQTSMKNLKIMESIPTQELSSHLLGQVLGHRTPGFPSQRNSIHSLTQWLAKGEATSRSPGRAWNCELGCLLERCLNEAEGISNWVTRGLGLRASSLQATVLLQGPLWRVWKFYLNLIFQCWSENVRKLTQRKEY